MPITFNSEGGFLAGTISSSGNDIFITTSGSVGSINIGNQTLSGSEVIEKDASGKIRNKKIFNDDGTITRQKFDQNEKITETKVKNPSSGKEFIRSGSATSNQIEMLQNANGAFITVSGSVPGYNIIQTPQGGSSRIRQIRFNRDFFFDGGSSVFTVGVDSASKAFFVNSNIGASATATSLIRASASGDFFVQGKIFAQEFHTKLISSSIVFQSGSTIFGDTHDDTHTFTGKFVNAITASGDISSSGTITAEHIVSSDDLNVTDRLTVDGDIFAQSDVFVADTITHTGDTDTKMTFGTDSITFTAGNVEMLKLSEGSIGDVIVLNEGGVDVNLRVESNNNASMLFVDGGNDRVGIGTNTPGKTLEVVGDISASGDVFAHSGSFTYITASIVDVDGDTIRFGGEPFTKANIQTLKLGRSLKTPRAGRTKPDVDGDDGVFDGNITASGFISASGDGNHFIGGKINLNSTTPGNQEVRFGGAARIQGNNTFLILDSDNQFVARADDKMNFNTPLFGLGGFDTNDTPSATLHISGAGDTRLFVEGNITASGFHLPDDGKITIGDVGDLQLYHNGNHSFIEDSGTGNLILLTSIFQVKNAANNETMIQANQDGAVKLNHNNSTKFETTATGVDVTGNISSSGTITGNALKGGATQNTGSYDFPGAIVGYNVQGLNVTHASYSLTTTMAVPDAGLNVCFVAPKSGIVEIEVQLRADGGSSGVADLTLGLSDSDTYNVVQTYYEQNVRISKI